MSHTAYIQSHLEASGDRCELAQAGPDFIEVVAGPLPPTGDAVLVTRMDDQVYRDAVRILGAADGRADHVLRIEPASQVDVA